MLLDELLPLAERRKRLPRSVGRPHPLRERFARSSDPDGDADQRRSARSDAARKRSEERPCLVRRATVLRSRQTTVPSSAVPVCWSQAIGSATSF